MTPGLYIVGTPIGNLQDITLRALETLKSVSLILAEDTRHTRLLLDRHGIATAMLSYHKFNEAARVDEIIRRIRSGLALALVTDSGMPGISDPGARIVAACHREQIPVFAVPGPSSVVTAVALSGFESTGFVFGGFLPHKPGPRKRRLEELLKADLPVVLFESPYRMLRLIDEVESVAAARRIFVARELTKRFEEGLSGTPAELRAHFTQRVPKGEFVVIIDTAADGV